MVQLKKIRDKILINLVINRMFVGAIAVNTFVQAQQRILIVEKSINPKKQQPHHQEFRLQCKRTEIDGLMKTILKTEGLTLHHDSLAT